MNTSQSKSLENTSLSSGKSQRYYSMDSLRAFAALLGIFSHSAVAFRADVQFWAVTDVHAHWFFEWIYYFIKSFRMQVFFLIAGFFAHLLYHSRGQGEFVRNRFWRIFVPFVGGWMIVTPFVIYFWILGAEVEGRLVERGIHPAFKDLAVWRLALVTWLSPEYYQERFTTMHFWFLHQLLTLYIIAVICRKILSLAPNFYKKLAALADEYLEILLESKLQLLWFTIISAIPIMCMEGYDVDTPTHSLVPNIATTALFGFCFMMGWIIHRTPDLLRSFCRNWQVNLMVGTLLIGPVWRFEVMMGLLDPSQTFAPYYRLIFAFLYGLTMWGFAFGFIGLFTKYYNDKDKTWRYLSDASYWLYVAHFLFIIPLHVLFATSTWPAAIKYTIIVVLTYIGLFLSYHFCVRSTWLGQLLNGRRFP